MTRADLEHAAELLARLVPQTTPTPWRDGVVDGNRYAALVTPHCIRRCTEYRDDHPWMTGHPHDGYGGCLVAETMHAPDRRLMAVLRNLADELGPLLEAVAAEDVHEVTRRARGIAAAVIETHRPSP